MTTTTTTSCPSSSAQGSCGCAVYTCLEDSAGNTFYSLSSVSGQAYSCIYPNWWPGPCDEGVSTIMSAKDPALLSCDDAKSYFVDSNRSPSFANRYAPTTLPPSLSDVAWVSTGDGCPDQCVSGLFGLSKSPVRGYFPRWYPPVSGAINPATGEIGEPIHHLYNYMHQAPCSNPCGQGGWMIPATDYGDRLHSGLLPAPCTYVWRGGWSLIEYYHETELGGNYGTECASTGGMCIPPAQPDFPPANGTIGYGGCCKSGFYTTTTTTTSTTTLHPSSTSTTPPSTTPSSTSSSTPAP